MNKIRVLLADDHETILARVRLVLGDEFEIVKTVTNGLEAIKEVERLEPDVLVMDISMPLLNGLEAAARMRSIKSRTKIVILTVHEDADYVSAAFVLGVSGYVIKEDLATDLVPAIHAALRGGTYTSGLIQP